MKQAVADTFEKILEEIKDPESNLPIWQLGIVERFRYNEEQHIIYVFTTYGSHRPGCLACAGISAAIEHSTNRRIREELEHHFPGFAVKFVSE